MLPSRRAWSGSESVSSRGKDAHLLDDTVVFGALPGLYAATLAMCFSLFIVCYGGSCGRLYTYTQMMWSRM